MIDQAKVAFFAGFRWAVPEAFAAAVANFRFEQGDVLYRERAGYARLVGTPPSGLTAIQVRQPPRSARAPVAESEVDRKLAHWQSEVELDRIDLARGEVVTRVTTQGRLFTALWKGDESVLEGGEEPSLPRGARELAQALRESVLTLPPATGASGGRFFFVLDRASDASRAKAAVIEQALASMGRIAIADHSPAALAAPRAEAFHPTLVVREIEVGGAAPEAIEVALRRVLYGGASGADAERFSLARHGLLEAVDGGSR